MVRVLVVEDDLNTRYLIVQNLLRIGYVVDQVENGRQAVDLLMHDGDYNLVISDLRMPEMDGFELLDHVKQNYPQIPVVLLSVANSLEWTDDAVQKGVTRYLLKPFTHTQLIDTVRACIRPDGLQQ